jgi:hypothetical protein
MFSSVGPPVVMLSGFQALDRSQVNMEAQKLEENFSFTSRYGEIIESSSVYQVSSLHTYCCIVLDTDENNGEHVLGPLEFTATAPSVSALALKISCIFCDKMFENTEGKNDSLLHHMLIEHQLVISQVSQVCDFRR